MNKQNTKKGFTVVELLVAISIMMLLLLVVSNFQKDIFSLNTNLQNNLNAQLDARHLIKVMVTELRKTSQSSLGSYPIEVASSTGITFYSDVGNNGSIDKVRYFLSGNTIRRGVITPTGNPLVYNSGSEVLTTIMNSVVSSSTLPIFQYYSSAYDGTNASLATPVDIASIRLVKINIIIDKDPNRSPVQLVVTSNVTLRNLKDNF
ncbi:MAG: prepilin-type N-terminal cleavage/methylation domain-containing protein [Parcubacteria group bacterium]